MNLLLDTHILIWFLSSSPQLTKKTIATLQSAEKVYASTVNIWEIVLKHSIGKLEIEFEIHDLLNIIDESGFDILSIKPEHAIKLTDLPDYHSDPFDRMLISQSLAEPLHLLTSDSKIGQYKGNVILV